eukprot:13543490-Ditylum_brightwellii.AAC.1
MSLTCSSERPQLVHKTAFRLSLSTNFDCKSVKLEEDLEVEELVSNFCLSRFKCLASLFFFTLSSHSA